MSQKVLVVGGRGMMGGWFARFFESEGFEVATSDVKGRTKGFAFERDWRKAAPHYDVVLFATPMDKTAALLRKARGTTGALLLDISSLKTPVAAPLRALAQSGHRVASLHPMWGPEADVLSDKNLLVSDCGDRRGVSAAKRLFRRTAVNVKDVRLDRHDELMAWSLCLPHATNLVFADALSSSGFSAKELSLLGGPTFHDQIAVSQGVAAENAHLYHLIQALNPKSPAVYRAMENSIARLSKARRSPRRFFTLMRNADAYYRNRPRRGFG